jgi:hypothetical protein
MEGAFADEAFEVEIRRIAGDVQETGGLVFGDTAVRRDVRENLFSFCAEERLVRIACHLGSLRNGIAAEVWGG